jgi:hypothetical protein
MTGSTTGDPKDWIQIIYYYPYTVYYRHYVIIIIIIIYVRFFRITVRYDFTLRPLPHTYLCQEYGGQFE